MTLCTDDCETTCIFHFLRKLDIGTTTGHVCRDGDSRRLTGMLHDLCLTCMLLCIQHLMLDTAKTEHTAKKLGCLDIGSTHEDRTSLGSKLDHLVDHSVELGLLCLIDKVIVVDTGDRPVGRDHNNIKLVDRPELACLRLRCTGHTGKLVIHTEVVLEGDGCECLRSGLDLHVLLRLDSLMESVAPAASFHDTTGLLIDDLDLSVLNDIVNLLIEHCICLKELVYSMYTLRLEGEISKDLILLHLLFLCRKS